MFRNIAPTGAGTAARNRGPAQGLNHALKKNGSQKNCRPLGQGFGKGLPGAPSKPGNAQAALQKQQVIERGSAMGDQMGLRQSVESPMENKLAALPASVRHKYGLMPGQQPKGPPPPPQLQEGQEQTAKGVLASMDRQKAG